MPDHLRFADDFPTPDLAAWVETASKGLRGRPLDDLAWQVGEGAPLSPLATAADLEGLPHLDAGPTSWLGSDGPWRSRELVVAPRPSEASRQARTALDDGIDQVELCFDDLTRDAREPGDHGEPPGVSGISIHTLADFRAAVDGIDLANTTLGISAGECATTALAYLACIADERGIDPAALRGDVDFDPIARLTQRQAGVDDADEAIIVSTHASREAVFDETFAVVRGCARELPGIRPLAIDGQGYHLAGADAAREVACMLATLAETARELMQRGASIDEVAAASTVRVQVAHEILLEVAKLRALRPLWARVLHAFGAAPEHLGAHVLAVTSGRSRAYRYDLRTNLLRTTLSSFAAVVGGCDVLSIVPFDEDPAAQDDSMRRLARHQHHLLRDESYLDSVRDPAGGSFSIEQLTDRISRDAWAEFVRIEKGGGMCEALQDGSLFDRVTADAEARTRAFAQRRRTLVGINRYVDADLEGTVTADAEAFEAEVNELGTAHVRYLEGRGEVELQHGGDLLIDARTNALAGATSGEIARAAWPEDATFRHRFLPIALLDGDEFEDMREENGEDPHRVALVRLDAEKSTTADAAMARSVLRAGGFAIEECGPLALSEVRDAARQAGAEAIVVCGVADAEQLRELVSRARSLAVVGTPDADLERRGVVFWNDGTDWIDAMSALAGGHDVA